MDGSKITLVAIGARGFPDVQGGIETFAENVLPRLADAGLDVVALTMKSRTKIDRWNGVRFVALPGVVGKHIEKPLHVFLSTLYCVAMRPDIVFIMGLNGGLFLWLLKLFGIKVISRYSSQDYKYPKWGFLARCAWRCAEWQFPWSDCIVVNSHSYYKFFMNRRIGCPLEYIPNGIAVHPKVAIAEDEEGFLGLHGLSPGGYLLAVGRITPEKNYETLIEAHNQLPDGDLKLVIVGEDASRDSRYRDDLELLSKGRVTIINSLGKDRLAILYRNCLIYVNSSIFEGMSNAILEAISFKCMIIVSDIEANKNIGLPDDCYYRVKDYNMLANKIIEFKRKNVRIDYSELLEIYNWDDIAKKYEGIIRGVL